MKNGLIALLLLIIMVGCAQNRITLSAVDLGDSAAVECNIRIQTTLSRIDTVVKGGKSVTVGYNGNLENVFVATSSIQVRDSEESKYTRTVPFLAKDKSRYIVYFVRYDPVPLTISDPNEKVTVPEIMNFDGLYSKVVILSGKCFQIVSKRNEMYLANRVEGFDWRNIKSDSEYVEIKNYQRPKTGTVDVFYRYIPPEELDEKYIKMGI